MLCDVCPSRNWLQVNRNKMISWNFFPPTHNGKYVRATLFSLPSFPLSINRFIQLACIYTFVIASLCVFEMESNRNEIQSKSKRTTNTKPTSTCHVSQTNSIFIMWLQLILCLCFSFPSFCVYIYTHAECDTWIKETNSGYNKYSSSVFRRRNLLFIRQKRGRDGGEERERGGRWREISFLSAMSPCNMFVQV